VVETEDDEAVMYVKSETGFGTLRIVKGVDRLVLATVPGLEPDRMVQSGLLPGKQGYPPGSGTG